MNSFATALLLCCVTFLLLTNVSPFRSALTRKENEALTLQSTENTLLFKIVERTSRTRRAEQADNSSVYQARLVGTSSLFYAQVYIDGSHGETPLRLQVDTGSSLSAIIADLAPKVGGIPLNCSSEKCSQRACDAAARCRFHSKYADNSEINGYLLEARWRVLGAKEVQFDYLYGLITARTGIFEPAGVHGIIGLSQFSGISCLPNCVLPLFDALLQKNLVKEDVFGIYMSLSKSSGELIMGEISQEYMINRPIFYSMSTRFDFYMITLYGAKLNGAELVAGEPGDAIVDTGTSTLMLVSHVYKNIKNIFLTRYCNLSFVCSPDGAFFVPGTCSYFDMDKYASYFPNLTLEFDTFTLTLTPRNYFLRFQGRWCFGIQDAHSESRSIFGLPFFDEMYVVFDRKNSRVGYVSLDNRTRENNEIQKLGDEWIMISVFLGCQILIIVITIVIAFVRKRLKAGVEEENREELIGSENHLEMEMSDESLEHELMNEDLRGDLRIRSDDYGDDDDQVTAVINHETNERIPLVHNNSDF